MTDPVHASDPGGGPDEPEQSQRPAPDQRVDAPRPPGGHVAPPPRPTPFQRDVVAVVAGLEPGDVLTYGEVASEAGHPGAAQAVANVLRRFPGLPWWRVVPTSGRLYRTHAPTQRPLLEADGVQVDAERRVQFDAERRVQVDAEPHRG